MSRILFATLPFAGCLHPHLAVAQALHDRGHEVAFYTGAAARPRVMEQGFACFPFDPRLDDELTRLVLSPESVGLHWRRPWALLTQLRRFFVGTVHRQVNDLEEVLDQWRPDLIACDPAIWAPFLIVRETRRVAVVILSYVPWCTVPGPDAPPMGLGLAAPRTLARRVRSRLAGSVLDLFRKGIQRAASDLRVLHALPPLDCSVVELAARLPLFLVPGCPEFDYRRGDLPPSIRYVGPLQWYPPRTSPDWLGALPRDRPWIHATEGTIHVQKSFVLRATAEGLADRPFQVILSTGGGHRQVSDLGPLASNVRAVPWVNHDQLLPRTDVLVCTGGAGAVMAALDHGVPVVGIPTEWDHADTVQRLVEAGAGVRLSPRRCTPARVRAAVERVLGDASFAKNARRLSVAMRRQGGPDRAASLIEAVAAA